MGSSNAKVAPDFADVRSSAAREGVLPSEWEVLRRESSSWRRLQTVAPRGVNLPPDIQDHEAHVKDLERFLRRMALRPKKFTQSVEQKRIRTFGEDYAEEAAFPRQMGRSWGSLRVLGKLARSSSAAVPLRSWSPKRMAALHVRVSSFVRTSFVRIPSDVVLNQRTSSKSSTSGLRASAAPTGSAASAVRVAACGPSPLVTPAIQGSQGVDSAHVETTPSGSQLPLYKEPGILWF
ncbi:unnamed protein product [Durusdinium trenchii]|uniref:Uncharacterized protein n=1 Tax=Durusdinium trenchii TaxID=1381693 RepID=A0ABP0KB58_9DINO